MKIPQFLYVPKVNTLGNTKLIIETKHNIYWNVLEFGSVAEGLDYINDNYGSFGKNGIIATNAHKKYPIVLLCLGYRSDKELSIEKIIRIGNIASDWYAQFFLRNKELSNPKFSPEASLSEKAKEYFKHWVWGDNVLSNPDLLYLINLEYGVMVKFNNADAMWAGYEEFANDIADVQFLSGHRPSDEEVERLTIDAYNFLRICERINDDETKWYNEVSDDIFAL